jgi:hypothetical protein
MASSIRAIRETSSSIRLYPRTANEHADLEILVGVPVAMDTVAEFIKTP